MNAPLKYVTTNTPCPVGYCPECWAANRVIPLRAGAADCWVEAGMRKAEPEIEAPPVVQAALEFDVP